MNTMNARKRAWVRNVPDASGFRMRDISLRFGHEIIIDAASAGGYAVKRILAEYESAAERINLVLDDGEVGGMVRATTLAREVFAENHREWEGKQFWPSTSFTKRTRRGFGHHHPRRGFEVLALLAV